MTSSTPSPDPYRSPAYFGDHDVPDEETLPRRPGGLTAICVIAIILGGIGVITGLVGVAGLLAGQALQKSFAPPMPQNADNEIIKIQVEMNDQMQAVARQFLIPNTVVTVIHLAVAIALLVGAVQSLMLKPAGRRILIATFCFAILFELVRAGVQLYVQMHMMAVMEVYWPRMMETAGPQQGPGGPDMARIMRAMFAVIKAVAYGMIIVFMLVKGIFYAVGASYMARRKIGELFERAVAQRSPIDVARASG